MKFAAFLLICLTGCSTTEVLRREPVDLKDMTSDEVIRRHHDRRGEFVSLKAMATLTLESPKSSNQFSVQIAVKYPDSIYVKIEGILGVDGLKASINRNTFVVYNIINRTVIRGTTSSAAIRNAFDYDVSFDEMMEILTGHVVLKNSEGFVLSADSSYYVLTRPTGEGIRKYWIDPYADFAVARIEDRDSADQLILERDFTRFEKVGGHYLPRYVRVYRPQESDFLSLYFDSREMNKTVRSQLFLISYPKSVEVVERP